jgi:hypothetical protein
MDFRVAGGRIPRAGRSFLVSRVAPHRNEVTVTSESPDKQRGASSARAKETLTYFEWVSKILEGHEPAPRSPQPPQERDKSAA